jgi:hypothetical protein
MASDADLDTLVRELAGKTSSNEQTKACQIRLDAEARAARARAAARLATLSPVPTSLLDVHSQDCPLHNAGWKFTHSSSQMRYVRAELMI